MGAGGGVGTAGWGAGAGLGKDRGQGLGKGGRGHGLSLSCYEGRATAPTAVGQQGKSGLGTSGWGRGRWDTRAQPQFRVPLRGEGDLSRHQWCACAQVWAPNPLSPPEPPRCVHVIWLALQLQTPSYLALCIKHLQLRPISRHAHAVLTQIRPPQETHEICTGASGLDVTWSKGWNQERKHEQLSSRGGSRTEATGGGRSLLMEAWLREDSGVG